jgi:hypothetical protein
MAPRVYLSEDNDSRDIAGNFGAVMCPEKLTNQHGNQDAKSDSQRTGWKYEAEHKAANGTYSGGHKADHSKFPTTGRGKIGGNHRGYARKYGMVEVKVLGDPKG